MPHHTVREARRVLEPHCLGQMHPAHWASRLHSFPAVDAVGVEDVPTRGGETSQDERLHAYSANVPGDDLVELCKLLSGKVALGT